MDQIHSNLLLAISKHMNYLDVAALAQIDKRRRADISSDPFSRLYYNSQVPPRYQLEALPYPYTSWRQLVERLPIVLRGIVFIECIVALWPKLVETNTLRLDDPNVFPAEVAIYEEYTEEESMKDLVYSVELRPMDAHTFRLRRRMGDYSNQSVFENSELFALLWDLVLTGGYGHIGHPLGSMGRRLSFAAMHLYNDDDFKPPIWSFRYDEEVAAE